MSSMKTTIFLPPGGPKRLALPLLDRRLDLVLEDGRASSPDENDIFLKEVGGRVGLAEDLQHVDVFAVPGPPTSSTGRRCAEREAER